jgi:hypothetical protein
VDFNHVPSQCRLSLFQQEQAMQIIETQELVPSCHRPEIVETSELVPSCHA